MKILIVDDSRVIRVQLAKVLREANQDFLLFEAENGLEALQTLSQNADINIILSDINMPDMCGMSLAKEIKAKSEYDDIEVVFFTTECSPVMKSKARELGVSAWVPKPVKAPLILAMLKRISDKIFSKKEALA